MTPITGPWHAGDRHRRLEEVRQDHARRALIAEFTRRGLKVASVKHAHHDFQIDDAATDSARHRRAGAAQVAIVSSSRWAVVTELRDAPEPSLRDVLDKLEPCDLVLVEGYKSAPIPKIEARRREGHAGPPLAGEHPMVVAIASDHEVTDSLPPALRTRRHLLHCRFHLEDSRHAEMTCVRILAACLALALTVTGAFAQSSKPKVRPAPIPAASPSRSSPTASTTPIPRSRRGWRATAKATLSAGISYRATTSPSRRRRCRHRRHASRQAHLSAYARGRLVPLRIAPSDPAQSRRPSFRAAISCAHHCRTDLERAARDRRGAERRRPHARDRLFVIPAR